MRRGWESVMQLTNATLGTHEEGAEKRVLRTDRTSAVLPVLADRRRRDMPLRNRHRVQR